MGVVVANIKWVLLVSGLLTSSMFYALVAPQAQLRSTFGQGLDGPVAEIVVRNWGALIGVGGLLLIWAAYNPPIRLAAMAAAGLSKLIFIGLVLLYGRPFLGYQAGVAVAADSIMIVIFAACVLGARKQGS